MNSEPEVMLKPTMDVYLTYNGYKWIAHSPDRRDLVTSYPHSGPRGAVEEFAKLVTGRETNVLQRVTAKRYRLVLEGDGNRQGN